MHGGHWSMHLRTKEDTLSLKHGKLFLHKATSPEQALWGQFIYWKGSVPGPKPIPMQLSQSWQTAHRRPFPILPFLNKTFKGMSLLSSFVSSHCFSHGCLICYQSWVTKLTLHSNIPSEFTFCSLLDHKISGTEDSSVNSSFMIKISAHVVIAGSTLCVLLKQTLESSTLLPTVLFPCWVYLLSTFHLSRSALDKHFWIVLPIQIACCSVGFLIV